MGAFARIALILVALAVTLAPSPGGAFLLSLPTAPRDGGQVAPDSAWDPRFGPWPSSGPDGQVVALAALGADLYVGGAFDRVGALVAPNLARLDTASGQWSALAGTSVGPVTALATTDTDLLVATREIVPQGGLFVDVARLWRYQPVAGTWTPLGDLAGSFAPVIHALAIVDDAVFVGGAFTTVDGVPARNVARLSLVDGGWSGLADGVDGPVSALARDGERLYVGGAFGRAGAGVVAAGVAWWSVTGETWHALSSGVSWSSGSRRGQARALAVVGGDLYVSGAFDRAGGVAAAGVARWSSGGWSGLGSGLSGAPYQPGGGVVPDPSAGALVALGTTLYAFGGFSRAGGLVTGGGARWALPDGPWSATGGAPAASVTTVAVAVGSRLFVGGLTFVDGQVATVASYDTGSGQWAFVPGPGVEAGSGVADAVLALAAGRNGVFAGGWFRSGGGQVAHRVGLLTPSLAWRSVGETRGGADFDLEHVAAMAALGDRVFVGGDFLSVGADWATQQSGVTANALAQYDHMQQRWLALPSPPGRLGVVRALAVAAGALFVGADGQVWRYQIDSSVWTLLGETDGVVLAVAARGDDLLVGGQFAQVTGAAGRVSVANIARLRISANRWSALGAGVVGAAGGSVVRAIVATDDEFYVGGSFTRVGPIEATNVARYRPTTESWSALGSGVTGGVGRAVPIVNAIAVTGSDVYVGGLFTQAGGAPASNIARWNRVTGGWSALASGVDHGGARDGGVYALAVHGDSLFVGGRFTRAGGRPSVNIARWDLSRAASFGGHQVIAPVIVNRRPL